MKEIIFNRKEYSNYRDFYHDVYKKLNGKRFDDFDYCENSFGYNADILNEFLWYCSDDGNKYIFVNFDREKLKEPKNLDDYKYNIIMEVFEEFVEEYPNNKLEFRMDEEN